MSNFVYKVFQAEPRIRIGASGKRERVFVPSDRERIFPIEKEMGDDMIPVPIMTKYADVDVDIDIILSLPVGYSCVIYWGDGGQSAVTGTGAEVTYNHVYASAVLSYIISLTGNISSITSFKSSGEPVSGDISAFVVMTSLEYLWLNSTGVTGDIVSLIPLTALLDLRLNLSAVSAYTSGVLPNWDNCSFQLQDLGLSETSVSDFLIDLDSVSVASVESINIAGTNAIPNTAGLTAKSSLTGKGWTVTSTAAYGPNLFDNGDFEFFTGHLPDDWVNIENPTSIMAQDLIEKFSGIASLRFDVDAGNSTILTLQSKALVLGTNYRFYFVYKNDAGKTVRYKFNNSTDSLDLSGVWQPGSNYYTLPDSASWNAIEMNIVGQESGIHTFIFRNDSASSGSLWLNNFYLQEIL